MTKEEEFWIWFVKNKHKFVDRNHSNFKDYLNEFLENLHLYNENLFFEIRGNANNDEKDLVITALGVKEHFESVSKLVNSAPVIEKWKITALKPALSYEDRFFESDYYGVQLNTEEIKFIPLKNSANPDLIGLRVLVNNLDESKYGIYYDAVLMVINTIIGEKAAAADLSYVEVVKNDTTEETIGITELPEYIEWRKSTAKN